MLPRKKDADAHVALASGEECRQHQVVGHEVRGLEIDAGPSGRNRHQVHQVHAFAATGRRRNEHLGVHVAGRSQRRKVVAAVQYFARDLDPVVVERGLDLRDDRTFDLEVHVAPMVRVLRMALPLVGDADAACEADRAVDDQQLAVRTVVQAAEVVPLEWPVHPDLDAGLPQLLQERVLDLDAAGPVDHDFDCDACLRSLRKGVGKLPPDIARPVDVGLEVDGLPGGPDCREHRREDLVAVLQVPDLVAWHDGRPEQHGHFATELRVGDCIAMLDLPLELLLRRSEIHRDGDAEHRQRSRDQDCPVHEPSTPAGHAPHGTCATRVKRRGLIRYDYRPAVLADWSAPGSRHGPLAQSVEQLAFNQLVAGSTPARPTKIKGLRAPKIRGTATGRGSMLEVRRAGRGHQHRVGDSGTAPEAGSTPKGSIIASPPDS